MSTGIVIKQGPGGRPLRVRSNILPPGTSLATKPTYVPPPDRIRSVGIDGLWSPGQPVHPIAPAGTSPRGWQFLNFQNMIFTPRATEDYTFDDLRWYSRYPIARALIEARKDQLANMPWQIRMKPKEGETNAQRLAREQGDDTIRKLSGFFEQPSSDCDWGDFVGMWADEVLVTDAPSLLIRRTRAGDVGELRVLDGAMIVKYVDQNGWTPQDGSPAYAQLWWGMPGWNLTTDQLVYRPRAPRAHKLYGLSKTEMAAEYIELAWKRLEMMKRHYTDGMVPDAIQVVPSGVAPKSIAQQQGWLQDQLRGNLARLSGMMLLQGFTKDGKDQFLFPKNELVTDQSLDDMIIRILCFIYGVSHQRLMQQMNRASSETSQDASEEEGLEPDKNYILKKTNFIIQQRFGYPDYEFTFQTTRERDILKQAQTDQIYLNSGVNTVNEVRRNKGDDPSTDPNADVLLIKTGTGSIPLGETAAPAAPGAEGDGTGDTSTPPGKKKPGAAAAPAAAPKDKKKKKKTGELAHPAQGKCAKHEQFSKDCGDCREAGLEKMLAETVEKSRTAFHMTIDPHYSTPQSEQARHSINSKMKARFSKMSHAVGERAKRILGKADDNEALIKQILDDDDFWTSLWADVPDDLVQDLEAAALAGMTKSVVEAQIHITESGMINAFNAAAKEWALEHSAEMVGMRRDTEGKLVPNPNTAYNISEVTREKLRTVISDAFKTETPIEDVMAAVKSTWAFSDERAAKIARTEVSNSQVRGNAVVWDKIGLVKTAQWQHSNLPNVCQECLDNAAAGPVAFGTPYPSGDLYPGAHPECRCVLVSVEFNDPKAI